MLRAGGCLSIFGMCFLGRRLFSEYEVMGRSWRRLLTRVVVRCMRSVIVMCMAGVEGVRRRAPEFSSTIQASPPNLSKITCVGRVWIKTLSLDL
jgi:hypothetical protein